MNIIIINKWAENYADYFAFLDHSQHNVCYIVDDNGIKFVEPYRELTAGIIHVNTFDDIETITNSLDEFKEQKGAIDKIVALSEYNILLAGKLKSKYGVEECGYDNALKVVDKVVMKKTLQESSIRYPLFSTSFNTNDVDKFIEVVGFPVVIKPRCGASSEGVSIVNGRREFDSIVKKLNVDDYEYEEYIDGSIFHIDGLIQDNHIPFIKVSKYINSCYEFTKGIPVGSYMIDDELLESRMVEFTKDTLRALNISDSGYHLEVFLTSTGEIVFLEIGARQGGAEICPMIKLLYNFDLVEEIFKIQLGMKIKLDVSSNKTGGFLLFPITAQKSSRVVATSKVDHIDGIIKSTIPETGSILHSNGSYWKPAGKFIYEGESGSVKDAIMKTIRDYSIELEPAG